MGVVARRLGVSGVLVTALAASAALAPRDALAQAPKRGGTLVYAVNSEPPNYDCIGTTTFASVQTLNPHYSLLMKFDGDNYPEIKGDLAESWEVAPDGLTYTFKLRSNVKFHDGSDLTSEDVRASYERMWKPTAGVISVRKANYEDLASIETPDPRTIVFKLSQPNGSMLTTFAAPSGCIYSAAKLKQDPKWPEKNILGSGPFKFTGHVAGSHWTGERFDDYFLKGQPYLDGFRVQFMSGSTMVNALQAGQIMAEFRTVSPAERDKLKSALGDKITIEESPWLCKFDVYFNTTHKPYDDIRVRKALSLAIDRWKGAEAMSRIAVVKAVGGVMRPGYKYATPDSDLVAYPGFGKDGAKAKAEAKALLKEAGAENLSFRLLNRSVPMPFSPVGVYLIDQWRQIGVKVEHGPLDVAQQKSALLSGNYDVALDANCYDVDEPNDHLVRYISFDKTPLNPARYNDPELDALFEKQKRTTSETERREAIRAFEKRLIDQEWTVPVVWWNRIVAHTPALRGWKISPSHYINQDLVNVWLDQ